MALTKINNNTLSAVTTLPAGVGGKVLQVVTAVNSDIVTTTSSTYQISGLTASITPSSTSSKILVNVNSFVGNAASGGEMMCTIYRNSTNIITQGSQDGYCQNFNSAGRQDSQASFTYLDSPATTSGTSYTMYLKAQGGTAQVIGEGTTASIILMEVAG